MLQPRQLEDVSLHYANEIPELREFLAKAGLPVGTGAALHSVATRLADDHAFRRDLALHVWSTLDEREGRITNADLLAMLAIAAAGSNLAAQADINDAHHLLRFVIETRRSTPFAAVAAPAEAPAPAENRAQFRLPPEPTETAASPGVRLIPAEMEERSPNRNRAIWIGAAACALLVLGFAFWLARRSSAPAATASNAMPSAAMSATIPAPSAPPETAASDALPTTAPSAHASPASSRDTRAHNITEPPAPRPPSNVIPPTSAAPITATPAPSAPPPSTAGPGDTRPSASASVARAATAPAKPSPPTIDFRSAPLSSDDIAASQTPRLLRRPHPGAAAPIVRSDGTSPPSHPATVAKAAAGTVRPTVLGIMAGNVLYDPAPAYPAEASAAHVQGEVTIEAEVDRNGNVASARVVSGPPLLREAARDAVERWRYRPFLASGKPIAMGATAVLDFELP